MASPSAASLLSLSEQRFCVAPQGCGRSVGQLPGLVQPGSSTGSPDRVTDTVSARSSCFPSAQASLRTTLSWSVRDPRGFAGGWLCFRNRSFRASSSAEETARYTQVSHTHTLTSHYTQVSHTEARTPFQTLASLHGVPVLTAGGSRLTKAPSSAHSLGCGGGSRPSFLSFSSLLLLQGLLGGRRRGDSEGCGFEGAVSVSTAALQPPNSTSPGPGTASEAAGSSEEAASDSSSVSTETACSGSAGRSWVSLGFWFRFCAGSRLSSEIHGWYFEDLRDRER